MPKNQLRALVRILSGLVVTVIAGAVFGDRVLLQLKTTNAATAWGVASGAALPVFMACVWFRRSPRLARVRPLLSTVGGLAITLFLAGFIIMVRTDDRFTNRPFSAAVRRFDSSLLWSLAPLFVFGLVKRAVSSERDDSRPREEPTRFLITGWPDGEDRVPRSQWDCDDGFETFEQAVGAAKAWLATQPRSAEVEVLEDHGRDLIVAAIVAHDAVVPISRD
jgi:acyl-CoA synthetase (AMP-forming)/AMP-acid ligase II